MRYMCLVICFMKIVAPMMSQICFSIEVAQNPNPRMVIKGFMTLGLLCRVCDMFAATLPEHITKLGTVLNEKNIMVMKDD